STRPGSCSTRPGSTSTRQGSYSTRQGSTSTKPGSDSTRQGSTSTKPGSNLAGPGSTLASLRRCGAWPGSTRPSQGATEAALALRGRWLLQPQHLHLVGEGPDGHPQPPRRLALVPAGGLQRLEEHERLVVLEPGPEVADPRVGLTLCDQCGGQGHR